MSLFSELHIKINTFTPYTRLKDDFFLFTTIFHSRCVVRKCEYADIAEKRRFVCMRIGNKDEKRCLPVIELLRISNSRDRMKFANIPIVKSVFSTIHWLYLMFDSILSSCFFFRSPNMLECLCVWMCLVRIWVYDFRKKIFLDKFNAIFSF